MVTICFRYSSWVNPNSWNPQHEGSEFATLEAHQNISLYELTREAKRLSRFTYCRIFWWYDDEMFEVIENTRWEFIKNCSGELVQLIISPGDQQNDDEYNNPVRPMSCLRLRGGNHEDGECNNSVVPVTGAEVDEVGGLEGDYDDGMSSVASSVDTEAECETALHEARSNLQDLDDYEEESSLGDLEEGVECNVCAIHASSNSKASGLLNLGQLFDDKMKLQALVKEWHIKNARQCKNSESNRSRIRIICKENSCSWSVRGLRCKQTGKWTITRLGPQHTCFNTQLIRQHRHVDCQLISDMIFSIVNRDQGITIGELQLVIQQKYQMEATYRKIWYAKSIVIERIHGTHEEAFEKFHLRMLTQQHSNPGTVFEYAWKGFDVEKGSHVFDKWFWAYGSSIAGFPHCRPLISIDVTHLYSRYKGKLLVAMTYDANNHIIPLAFGLCDNETIEAWTWFLNHLRNHVTKNTRELCIISDRNKGILGAVEYVWRDGGVVHRYCARHLASNFNTHFKNIKLKKKFEKMVWTSSKVKFQDAFQRWKIANNGQYKQFIEQLGDFNKWSFAHDGGFRYGVMTTNHSEVFNKVLKGVRTLPLTALLMATFSIMTRPWGERAREGTRELAKGSIFLPKVTQELKDADEASSQMRATPYRDGVKYTVETCDGDAYVVNLEEKDCECGKFKLLRRPCSHAMCVIKKVGVSAEQYVDPHFKIYHYIQTYSVPLEYARTAMKPISDGPSVTFDPDMLATGKRWNKGIIHNLMEHCIPPKKNIWGKRPMSNHNKRICRTTT